MDRPRHKIGLIGIASVLAGAATLPALNRRYFDPGQSDVPAAPKSNAPESKQRTPHTFADLKRLEKAQARRKARAAKRARR